MRHIVGSFSFLFGKLYDTMIPGINARLIVYIHELLLIKALRLMSAFDDNLFIKLELAG